MIQYPSWLNRKKCYIPDVLGKSSLPVCLSAALHLDSDLVTDSMKHIECLSDVYCLEGNLDIGVSIFSVDQDERLVILHTPCRPNLSECICLLFLTVKGIDKGCLTDSDNPCLFVLITVMDDLFRSALRCHNRMQVCPTCMFASSSPEKTHVCNRQSRTPVYVNVINLIARQCHTLGELAQLASENATRIKCVQTCGGWGWQQLRIIAAECQQIHDVVSLATSKRLKSLYVNRFCHSVSTPAAVPSSYQQLSPMLGLC